MNIYSELQNLGEGEAEGWKNALRPDASRTCRRVAAVHA
jgi:hypothetical protein